MLNVIDGLKRPASRLASLKGVGYRGAWGWARGFCVYQCLLPLGHFGGSKSRYCRYFDAQSRGGIRISLILPLHLLLFGLTVAYISSVIKLVDK